MSNQLTTPTILIDGDEVDHKYFDTFIWKNFTPGETVHIDHYELIPVSAVFKSFVGGVVRLETTEESYQ